jgi:uncharacterized RDD family membrane protein YckC
MTQQNETEQQGAAEPGPPARYGYESVPEAYLAPPQPGKPRYGTPSHPGGGRRVAGRPGYGEPGYGQPPGGQPGYARPRGVRPGGGAAAQRDPALAPPWHRLVAQTIDWFIIMAVAQAVFWSQVSLVGRELQAATGRYKDLTTPAAQAAFNSIRSSASYEHALLFWFLGLFGIALAYYWVLQAVGGATVGKWVMGMRVVRASDRSRPGVLMAGVRSVAFLLGPAVFMLLTLLISPINVVGGILWAADSGMPLVDARAQSLHDKLAGTVVVSKRALGEPSQR